MVGTMTIEDRTAIRECPGTAAFHPEVVSTIISNIPEGMTIAEYRRRRCAATAEIHGFRRAVRVVSRAPHLIAGALREPLVEPGDDKARESGPIS